MCANVTQGFSLVRICAYGKPTRTACKHCNKALRKPR